MKNIERHELQEEIKWGGQLNEFLWMCAGVNKRILRQCRTDYAKYAGIGGTILFTALMAMLSGGYAIYTVFDSGLIALVFGVFWGLLIFNLDRFIVNTMYSDGEVTISWREFTAGLPRIIIAIFLGVVISTPLELKIFEDEINVTIQEQIKDRIKEYQASDYTRIAELENRKDTLKLQIKEIEESPNDIYGGSIITSNESLNTLLKRRHDERAKYDNEILKISNLINQRNSLQKPENTDDISKYEEYNLKYKQLSDEIFSHVRVRNDIKAELNNLDAQIASMDNELRLLQQKSIAQKEKQIEICNKEIEQIDKDIQAIKDRIAIDGYATLIKNEYGGFQAKMSAFSKMKEENSSTNISSIFIMLLFVIIETAPTFFKMMIASGPYDDLLRSEMHKARVMSDKRISDLNDEINTEILISTEKNKNRLEAEIAANKEVMLRIAEVQSELLNTAIEKWRKEELEKIEKNPSAYIKSSSNV